MLDIYVIYNFNGLCEPSIEARRCLVELVKIKGYKVGIDNIKTSILGKPYFENMSLKFSLSYSENILGIAICNSEVGIDIEKIRYEKNMLLIKNRFFSINEKEYLEKNDNIHSIFFVYGQKKRLM